LGKLIKKSQYEYFHLFKIPEELYHIRIEKFGELIRDIDRQIPLLVEERERIKGGVKKEEIKAERLKKIKKLIIVGISLVLIVAGFFLIIYFKLYSKIVLIVAGVVLTVILFTTLIFFYIRGKKKEEEKKKKPEIGKEKYRSLKIFISNKIYKLNLYFKSLIKKIKHKKEYRNLLKQKGEEERIRKKKE